MSADQPSAAATVRVPAKVNLHLAVGPLRQDGFHELTTVFHAVGIYDVISAAPAPELRLEVGGDPVGAVPTGADNLAWQAATVLARTLGRVPAVGLRIEKSIPVAGGMAGGSADAAGTLLACAHLWHPGMTVADLTPLAAELGSDVAFGLVGGTALGTGRGEKLSSVDTAGTFTWVIAVADFGISTAEAYRELDRLREAGLAPPPLAGPDAVLAALRAGDASALAAALANDLQASAFSLRPALADVIAEGERLGALRGIVSGSGPTCAFLCADDRAAQAVAAGLVTAGLCRETRVAPGPVPGPVVTR